MDELQQLEQLLDALLSTIQTVVQSEEILSDEFQGVLAQELGYLTSRIDELRAATPPIPPLDPAPFQSAVVNSFRYDPKSQDLFVKFQGDFPQQNGNIYRYSGVPEYIANIFSQGAVGPKTTGKNAWNSWQKGISPSHGAALNALLKKGPFSFTKLT